MISGKTKSGFEYTIDKRVLNDWRVLNGLRNITKKDVEPDKLMDSLFTVCEMILGEQLDAFVDYVASQNDGYADFETISSEIFDIFTSNKETKN